MPIINAGTNGGYVQNLNTVVANVQTGTGGTFSTGTSNPASCDFSFAFPNYFADQTFLEFDTSSILTTPKSATLKLYVDAITSSGPDDGDTLQARLYDYGTTIEAGDYRTSTQFNALTLLAHIAISSINVGSYTTMVSDNLAANINLGGKTRMVLCTDRFAAAGTPTGRRTLNVDFGAASNPSQLSLVTTQSGLVFMFR